MKRIRLFLLMIIYVTITPVHVIAVEGDRESGCCSQPVKDLNFRITNPSYPYPDSTTRSYSHHIQIQHLFCGLRIKFEYVELEKPAMGSNACSTDSITVLAPGRQTQPNCGTLSGYQINVPVQPKELVEVLIVTQSKRHFWSILISQLPCSNIRDKPFSEYQNICGKRPKQPNNQLPGTPSQDETNEQVQSGVENSDVPPSAFPTCPQSRDYIRCYLDGLIEKRAASTSMHNRIINGKPAKKHSWPWQVALLVNGKNLLCGGALISPSMVVTAGHCLSFVQRSLHLSQLVVVSGAHRLSSVLPLESETRTCEAAVLHSEYSDIRHDISICVLSKPMDISETISPVCLPYDPSVTYAGTQGYVTGWGKTRDDGGPSPVLQEAVIPIVRNQDCRKAWIEEGGELFSNLIEDFMVCGGGRNKSTCNGDSGGPLSYHNLASDTHTLVGLTSFGPSAMCNIPFKPLSVFTRITSQLQFISMAEARTTGGIGRAKTYIPSEAC